MMKITDFIKDHKKYFFGFYGYAGTGKTTVIMNYISHLIKKKYITRVAFCAPTHKAVTVLTTNFSNYYEKLTNVLLNKNIQFLSIAIEELKTIGITMDFLTIHRLLGYKGEFDIRW